MAYVSRVASTLPSLSLLLPRSHTSLLQIKSLPSTHSKVQCCFASQYSILSISGIAQRRLTTVSAEASSEQRRDIKRRPRIERPPTQQNRQYSTKSPKLEKPEVIFSNNHVLVVNKPAGWKSQPGDGGGGNNNSHGGPDPKCLLTYLKSQSLGGGSQKDFISPTHRLDQPCTGVLIFAKNGKAASRVQVAWSKRKVKKCYWVVVEGSSSDSRGGGRGGGKMDGLEVLRSRSIPLSGGGNNRRSNTYKLSALLKSNSGGKGRNARGGGRSSNNNAGGSVTVKPLPPNISPDDIADNNSNGRVCHIEWNHLLRLPSKASSSSTRHLLSVTTDTGAKHQVRALLALAGGAPIAGDLRYGNNNHKNNAHQQHYNDQGRQQGRVDGPLPDGSVALHARDVFLPTVSLGGMEFLKDEPFVASVPKRWREFFGVCEDDVRGLS